MKLIASAAGLEFETPEALLVLSFFFSFSFVSSFSLLPSSSDF